MSVDCAGDPTVFSNQMRLPDFAFSLPSHFPDLLARNIEEPCAALSIGQCTYALLRLSSFQKPRAVAYAVRRARLGCVFGVAGGLYSAIQLHEEPQP